MKMKKTLAFLLSLILVTVFAPMAFAGHGCDGNDTPVVANADASAFVNTNITADQMVYNQVKSEKGLLVSNTNTFDLNASGYGAFHNGPANDGKGFFGNELSVSNGDTLKVACYSTDLHSQGMSQAMTTAGNAGAGVSATGGAKADAAAGGVSGGVQSQYTTYNLNGMSGAGSQVMGTGSFVSVNTTTH